MARKLEELRVYQRAMEFSKSVTALLDRQAYRKDRDLWGQTSEANDSIPSKRYITVEELAIRVDAAERLSRSLGAFNR